MHRVHAGKLVRMVAGIAVLCVAAMAAETVSIKPCAAFRANTAPSAYPGTQFSGCTTVRRYIQQAYGLFANGHMNPLSSVTITDGPAWVDSDLYEIDVKTDAPRNRSAMNGPRLQAALEDRFQLKVHRETRQHPVYALTVAKAGPALQPFEGRCIVPDFDNPRPRLQSCGSSRPTEDGVAMTGVTVEDLRMFFLVTLDREVLDRTGLTARYNVHLELPEEVRRFVRRAHVLPALSNPTAAVNPSLTAAVKTGVKKLGLNLEPATGPGEFLIIDHIARPSGN